MDPDKESATALTRHYQPDSPDAANGCKTAWIHQKRRDIIDACKWRDLASLRSLAESRGGFLDDHLRRAACACSSLFMSSQMCRNCYMHCR